MIFFLVMSSEFNGESSYVVVQLDGTVFPFGVSGSFEFRTRERGGRVMFIQLSDALTEQLRQSLEFQLFNGQMQVIYRESQGLFL